MRIGPAYLLPLVFLVGCETTQPEKRHYLSTYYGMEEKQGALGSRVMIRESDPKRMERYERVIIEDIKVIPAKNLDPKVKQATREEAEKLAEQFEVILAEELGKSFEITRYRSYKTLTVRAALTELQPSDPALFMVNYLPYASAASTGLQLLSEKKNTIGAGSTTVEIEVLDSRSRRQLFAMVDRIKGSKLQPGGLEKWGQTEGSMRMWAKQVHKAAKGQMVGKTPSTEKGNGTRTTR